MKLAFFLILALAVGATDYIHIAEPPRTGAEPYLRSPGDYPENPDAQRRPDVAAGDLEMFEWNDSSVYPGTTRRYWVYTPAQYDAQQPAAVMVFQDGRSFIRGDRPLRAPVVMDNLMADGLMPVTIGIFIDPGQRPPLADEGRAPPNPNLPLNRRVEYDRIDDRYATFLDSEILAVVRQHRNLSTDPVDWAIVGNSSGGIAAFVAAWHRPDLFGKVAVHNGTFVNLLGGDAVPRWVRDSESKALRVSLTSGPYDLSNEYGVWWDANRALAQAMAERGYDYRAVWSDNPHNPNFAGSVLGETFRWLWRDHPEVLADPPPLRDRSRPVLVQIPAPPRPPEYSTRPAVYERVPNDYPQHADSRPRPGVPTGVVQELTWEQSRIYPGTTRSVRVYVPAQYTPDRPAATMVFQDGHQWIGEGSRYRVETVLDNLIAAGDLPVIVAIFIDPGDASADRRVFPAPIGPRPQQPANRRDEYDNIDDRYARFLLEEILPWIGESYHLSSDPAHRALVGNSSGGQAAFNAAWHRPDQFTKVVAHVGSFTAIRGGHHYPQIIRESLPRPLRVFLQSGVNDLQIDEFGNWWEANLDLARELEAKRYDFKAVWGDGAHSSKHSAAIFPDTLRWLWRDWRE